MNAATTIFNAGEKFARSNAIFAGCFVLVAAKKTSEKNNLPVFGRFKPLQNDFLPWHNHC